MKPLQHHIRSLVQRGGPSSEKEYLELNDVLNDLYESLKKTEDPNRIEKLFRDEFGDTLNPKTMQGFIYHKPHGYAGDFEIIDRIYNNYVSEDPNYSNWDHFMNSQPATEAVRNRVDYFSSLLKEVSERSACCKVLNVASGPGRDMLYFFRENPVSAVTIDCIEQDENAIAHAKRICGNYLENITFCKKNALRFSTTTRYDLIWSAGLFDYFNDSLFVSALKRFRRLAKQGSEIVIGNFSMNNPSRSYMELLDWKLYHRTPDTLRHLAHLAGFEESQITVKSEETGVNLFLHIRIKQA